jgi:hypothetical protein
MSTKTVTAKALIARVNRKLAKRGQALRKTGSNRWQGDLGAFYVIDTWSNTIAYTNTDPATEAKELGCLGPNEIVREA